MSYRPEAFGGILQEKEEEDRKGKKKKGYLIQGPKKKDIRVQKKASLKIGSDWVGSGEVPVLQEEKPKENQKGGTGPITGGRRQEKKKA